MDKGGGNHVLTALPLLDGPHSQFGHCVQEKNPFLSQENTRNSCTDCHMLHTSDGKHHRNENLSCYLVFTARSLSRIVVLSVSLLKSVRGAAISELHSFML